VILFELISGKTPFHSRNRAEFEGKVKASDFNLEQLSIDYLTIETILFLNQCLQHNEDDRKCVSFLINHPYITKKINEQ
jgi:hypothetical protein